MKKPFFLATFLLAYSVKCTYFEKKENMRCFRTIILSIFLFIAGLRRMVKKTEHKNFGSQKCGLHFPVR